MKRFSALLSLRSVVMIFSLPFLLLIILSSVFFYKVGTEQVFNLISSNSISIVRQTTDSINNNLEQIYYLPSSLTTSHYFYKMRKNIEEDDPPFAQQHYLRFANTMEMFFYQNAPYIDSITLYLSDGSVMFHRSTSNKMIKEVNFNFNDYSELYKPYALNWIHSVEGYPYKTSTGTVPTSGLIEILGTADSQIKGFFLVGINDDLFINQIKNCKITANSSVTITKNGEPIYQDFNSPGAKTINNLSDSDKEIIFEKTNNMGKDDLVSFNLSKDFAFYLPLSIDGMGVLAIIPKEEMLLGYHHFSRLLIVLAAITIAICLALYLVISPLISKPVVLLLKKLSLISKDELDIPLEVGGSKEIVSISNEINNLLARIRLLIQSVANEVQEKESVELKILHAQINPHFLYNTLDSIYQLCELNEPAKAGKMVTELATFYRIGISKDADIIPLVEELSHTIMYLSILKTRYEDFQYEVNVPEEFNQYNMVKIILQPLVENALYHGLRPYRNDGTIFITAKRKDNDLYIYVKDNGGGIQENILDDIKSSLNTKNTMVTQQPNQVYGLKNVHRRLILTYGEGYGLNIESCLDEGTTVIVKIPINQEDQSERNII